MTKLMCVSTPVTAALVESNIPYSKTREYKRLYMQKRRRSPEFLQKERSRDKELSILPERRTAHAQQAKARGRLRKLKGIAYLGNQCNHCRGVFHPSIFEFHHVNPEEKEVHPSQALQKSWENFKLELDKCILLCANCHRLVHHNWETSLETKEA